MRHVSRKKQFYTYALLDPCRPGLFRYGHWVFHHEPFYLGKGKAGRKDRHQRQVALGLAAPGSKKSARISEILEQGLEVIVRVLRKDLRETEALALEIRLIRLIGRDIDEEGPLLNLTRGGDGISGYSPTETDRINLSYAGLLGGSKAKSESHRDSLSLSIAALWKNPEYRRRKMINIGRKPSILSSKQKRILLRGIRQGISVKSLIQKHQLPCAASRRFTQLVAR